MNDILDSLEKWLQRNERIAVTTVVDTWGSAPRPIGAKMAATLSGGIAGSVSAGCVENAVLEESKAVIKSGKPRLLSFGVADDQAFEVGLACGGTIKVFVEPFEALQGTYEAVKQHLAAREPMAVVSVVEGPEGWINRKLIVLPDGRSEGDLTLPDSIHQQVVSRALERLAQGVGGIEMLPEEVTLFVDVYPPVPRLIIVGAVHIADPLVAIANLIGFDTIIVDPRGAFNTRERFPHATTLIKEWPQKALAAMSLDRWAYVVVLTHDPKLDDPALQVALTSEARYVGALGSRRTNALRIERLRKAGLTEERLARLHAPVGLDIGGRSPAEIALSIMAEIVRVKNGLPTRVAVA